MAGVFRLSLRSLHTTRVMSMRATPKLLGKGAGCAPRAFPRSNLHLWASPQRCARAGRTCRWEQAANGFPEIPKGKKTWDLWYNPAVRPRQTAPSPRGPADAGADGVGMQ